MFTIMENRNKHILTLLFSIFIQCTPSFSQTEMISTGGTFIKIMEFNAKKSHLLADTKTLNEEHSIVYNTNSKSKYEKLLFGDKNAFVEFVVEPSFSGVYGFRLLKDQIEIKFVDNYKDVLDLLQKKYPTKDSSDKIREITSEEEFQKILKYNSKIYSMIDNESLSLYKTESISEPITELFSQTLSKCIYKFIDTFRAVYSGDVIFDGESYIFRCIVGDEVWMLRIHAPRGNAKKIAHICNSIFSDVKNGTFNENKYIKELEEFIHE